MFEAKSDTPFRVIFPQPVILHGSKEKTVLETALEYLRQPGKVRIEPLGPDDK
jgi:hypothetical protein